MNPEVSRFFGDNPKMTMLGFAWACFWRLYLVSFGAAIVIAILAAIFK